MNYEEHIDFGASRLSGNPSVNPNPLVVFKVYKKIGQHYSFQLMIEGNLCLHSGHQSFSEEQKIVDFVKKVQFLSQNPFNYEVSVAGSGSYRFSVKDPATGDELAVSGGYDTEKNANDMIAKIRDCVAEAKVILY